MSSFLRVLATQPLFFLGHIYNVNVPMRTISVSWLIGGCGDYGFEPMPTNAPTGCGAPNMPVDVYLDGSSRPSFSYDPLAHPWDFRGSTDRNETMNVQSLNQFQTTYLVDLHTQRLLLGKMTHNFDQQYFYPFDTFHLGTNLIAMSPESNTTSFKITTVGFSDYVNGFVPVFDAVPSRTRINGTIVDSHYGELTVSRNNTARTFVMILLIVNWALTGVVVYITAGTLVLGSKIGDGILVLPVTVILTLPALRALFVENPPFGILIDILGLFMQMIIVSLCSLILLFNSLTQKTEQRQYQEVGINLHRWPGEGYQPTNQPYER
ncbi:hypothetical protein GALMADRAFT_417399 [Galerina marginata CBS 339.88]|uniref:Transmembrane protein n=1 Tax=Galerina marginata (strain CBS 339.88) TaxID=685588 RepID=A0A067TD34_GALM3|nr:hypothetical protein GALMADRAFT_417399 [Galerina marginata CBS 339.88]